MTEEPWWKKHVTFQWSDPLVEEILGDDWEEMISPGEARELAKDFKTLKQKFKNLAGMLEAEEFVLNEYLDKINTYSDEELLRWRKDRNDKIAADMKMLEEIFNDDKTKTDA
jgi:hypothetical protein